MSYEIEISGTPQTWNAFVGNRTHWAYYRYNQAIGKSILAALTPLRDARWPLPRVRLIVCCGYPTKRKSDIDSLAIKAHVDALVRTGIIADDHKEIVREVRVTWEKSDTPWTKITITPL